MSFTPPRKRARFSSTNKDKSPLAPPQSRVVDGTSGQNSAFPGLEDGAGADSLYYGPADNGIDYLRMVR